MAKAKKSAKPKQVPHYDRSKLQWEAARKKWKAQFAKGEDSKPDRDWKVGITTALPITAASNGNWMAGEVKLPVKAVPFLKTLTLLGFHLRDRRYHDLCRELATGTLIDPKTGNWVRPMLALATPETRDMCRQIEESIASRRVTERVAIANAVAWLGIEAGSSFDTSCKRVKRLLVEYRKTRGTKPR